MYVNRAISTCPRCNHSIEIWFYKSKVEPTDTIKCISCESPYVTSNFVTQLLELRVNVTPSAVQIAQEVTICLQ